MFQTCGKRPTIFQTGAQLCLLHLCYLCCRSGRGPPIVLPLFVMPLPGPTWPSPSTVLLFNSKVTYAHVSQLILLPSQANHSEEVCNIT